MAEQKNRLLIVSHMYPNLQDATNGIFVKDQATALTRLGWDIRVVAPVARVPWFLKGRKQRWDELARIPSSETVGGITIYHPRTICLPRERSLLLDGFLYYLATRKTVRRIREEFRFDCIHVHGVIPDAVGAVMLNRKYRVPLVVNMHGRLLSKTLLKRGPYGMLAAFAFRRTDTVVTVGSHDAARLKRLFPFLQDVRTIHNGIDVEALDTAAAAEMRKNGDPHPLLLTVARLIERKNQAAVIEAVAALKSEYPKLEYRILGAGSNENVLRSLSSKLGVSENVKFLGPKLRPEVYREMSRCDIFVMPSWDEALGVVYLEAMALGKPIIGSKGEGIADIVEDGRTGVLVDARDVGELTDKIRWLASNPETARSLGAAGSDLVRSEYTWEVNARKAVALYRGIVTSSLKHSRK